MNDFAILVDKLSKRYRIGRLENKSRRRSLANILATPFQYLASTFRGPSPDEILWALNQVSFEVQPGELVGIIGRNGAGKSTLLKVLSRITEPTRGRAIINGRVGSLLEVGTGFHPELTGRENIYLNGVIMGMRKGEIDRKFDEIVDFSGVEKFIDTPVKRYSSGMYVRLAFAVAAHLEPEILMIDEVLAVGDSAFQKKCLGKMSEVAKVGRTILFVSHNLVALKNLCNRAIWVDHGEIKEDGSSHQVILDYLRSSSTESMNGEVVWEDLNTAPGNDEVRIHSARVYTEESNSPDIISLQTPLSIEIQYWNLVPDAHLHITLHIYNEEQIVAFSTASFETDPIWNGRPFPTGLFRSICHIPPNFLNAGTYRILLLIVKDSDTIVYQYENILSYNIEDTDERTGGWFGREPGVIRPKLSWKTEYFSV